MRIKLTAEEEKERLIGMRETEDMKISEGFTYVAGVDEAGRGPLAGPVYAAAVILKKGQIIDGVNDSKKLTAKKRDILFDKIVSECEAYCIASVDEKTIDEINILNATHMAMNKAVDGLPIKADYVLIDGNSIKNMQTPHETVVKGDMKCLCIAAASILAKVSRDRYMEEMAQKYPQYGFDKHAGYGTKAHYAAIHEFGECPIHRKTFLKKFYERENESK